MSNLTDLAAVHGEDVSGIGPIQNVGGGYYTHLIGEYQGLVSKFSITYKDKEGKKCKKDKPGATPAFAGLKLVILKDPEKGLVDNSLQLVGKEDIGRHIYNVYISLEPDKQFANVINLKDFTSNNLPEADVVQGKKNEEQIYLANLPLFYGCPIKWELIQGKKDDARYSKNILLVDHQTLTQELLKKRKAITDQINATIDTRLEEIQAQRKAEKDKSAGEGTPSEAVDTETFQDSLDIPSVDAAPPSNEVNGGSEDYLNLSQ